jgi:hypothetical protein
MISLSKKIIIILSLLILVVQVIFFKRVLLYSTGIFTDAYISQITPIYVRGKIMVNKSHQNYKIFYEYTVKEHKYIDNCILSRNEVQILFKCQIDPMLCIQSNRNILILYSSAMPSINDIEKPQ